MMPQSNTDKIIIEEIDIISFGKLENFKLSLGEGLNVIYGSNESGKSTIQLFIKAMLYGLPSRKKSGEHIKERERAIPWTGNRAEGVLRLSVCGRHIEIRRRFGKTAAGDKVEVCDSITGEPISKYSGNIGEELLGIPCEVFEKTMWIRQSGVSMEGKDEELTARLMNLRSSGDETVSVDAALKALTQEKRQLKAKDGRSAKGRIDVLRDRREECRRQKYDLATRLAQAERTDQRLAEARKEQTKITAELEMLEQSYKKSIEAEKLATVRQRLKNIEECNQNLDLIYKNEDYIRGKELCEEDVNLAREIENRLADLKKEETAERSLDDAQAQLLKKSSRASGLIGGGGVLTAVALGAAAIFFISASFALAACALVIFVIGIAAVILGITTANDCKNIKRRLAAEKEAKQQEEKVRSAEELELGDRYQKLISPYGVADAAELSRLYIRAQGLVERACNLEKARLEFLANDSYEDLKKVAAATHTDAVMSAEEIEKFVAEKRSSQLALASEIKGLESKMAYDVKIDSLPADIDTELAAIEEEMRECERRLLVIEAAEAAIAEAADEWRRNFAPALTKRVDEIVGDLTDGKYDGVRVSEDYRMRVSADNGLYDAEYFSCGTYEQLYFALRIAASELICKDAPLFLDDILTVYDNERALAALKFLNGISGARQALVFTCHLSDRENAGNVGARIINLY